jgi:DNA replication and repair protein RecF
MSELDGGRQNHLLESLQEGQTFITCTGLDELIENRFHIDHVFRVVNGAVFEGKEPV